ncbi:MAG: YncE family protein [Muribaculaceae bacterium]|nr:YncE family protein [Muribaculaceae bacterium]
MKRPLLQIALLVLMAATVVACRDEQVILLPEIENVSQPEYTSVRGFYLLNEANMASNKASLDYYNYASGRYSRNVYERFNPGVVMKLGDVGNDIAIYGNRLYAVINCSNKVEVMDKNSVARIGQIDIPNCRYIQFHKGYAYVTSYAGPVDLDLSKQQIGYVAKVDTATMQVVDRCLVGYQPDGLAIVNDRLYVANSGGYNPNNYENTISVLDLNTFTEVARVPIAINLQYCLADRRGILWISSRGDYYHHASGIYAYDTRKQRLLGHIDCQTGNVWMDGDSLYVVGKGYSKITEDYGESSYIIINTLTMQVVNQRFITDGTDQAIAIPYGVAVNPITKDIYVTDAKNYITPGRLYCFGQDGVKKWDVLTGDIPAHFVFLGENLNDN